MILPHLDLTYILLYKYAQKEYNNIRNARLAEAISRNKNRDLWKEVKAMTHATQELPSVIDGQIGDENIAKIFHEKSKKLYNSVGFSPNSITELKEKINRKLENNCITNQSEVNLGSPSEKHLHNLTVNDLKKAIDDLKKDKKDESGLSTNHLKMEHINYILF